MARQGRADVLVERGLGGGWLMVGGQALIQDVLTQDVDTRERVSRAHQRCLPFCQACRGTGTVRRCGLS